MAGNAEWKTAFIGECMIELQRAADGSIRQTFGGDTFNTAAYVSRLGKPFGIRAEYVSALGDDNFSGALRAFWSAEGVESPLTRAIPGKRPGLYFIDVDGRGERSFTYWRGEAAARDTFEESGGDHALQGLERCNAAYLSGISLAILRGNGRSRLLARLEELRAKGMRIFFDCNFRPLLWPEETLPGEKSPGEKSPGETSPAENARPGYIRWYERMAALADIVFISRDEVAALGLPPNADANAVCAAVRALGAGEVVLKDGGGACVVAHAAGTDTVPARALETVTDTTAAGDSFSAAYIVGRKLGLSPAESAKRAHILAASVVSCKGAIIPQAAMPDIFPV